MFYRSLLMPTHAGSDGSSPADRIWPAADRMRGCSRGVAAENAYGPCPASWRAVNYHNGWMNSPGHRTNILNPAFTHMAVALAGSVNSIYATQVFYECRR
jgi:uncharacterized protein YkwD